ncbi:MAG: xanthine dehydrogenase family protein subunit M [Alphaproteobacteria bacterium]|nr:xanthine dehydrogenase family protein subunit M [Alphaproteobacteria bacterium]
MIIRDMMPGFELYQPKSIEDAVALLDKHGKDSWRLAGGNDSLSWFKDRAKKPKVVVDLTAIPALRGIKETADGVEIGALTSLTEIERHPGIRQKFRTLAEAAAKVASPQIRNSGTLGGNVAQDARCWYYRAGMPCYRAGGNTCYADTPEGMNREHALFEADRCVAVTPSDINPVLVALEAKMVVRNAKGERVINAEDFFIGPRVDITRMTAMDTKDLLVAIRVPNTWAGAKLYFEKVADRESWDFPLVNIASAMVVRDGVVQQARIVCGGVQCTPRRLRVAEDVVKGKTPSPDVAKLAGQSVTRGARPLNYNHFKVPLMANLVARAVRDST